MHMFAGDLLQSYGGGVAAHIMGDSSKTFGCGIAVAPVATKAYYGQQYWQFKISDTCNNVKTKVNECTWM